MYQMVILFDRFNLPEDIYEVIFATKQQIIVAKLLIEMIKDNGGEIGKTEMSLFANRLHEGTMVDLPETVGPVQHVKKTKISYNKRQFYDRILTPMRSMGMIDYDMYKKKYILADKFSNVLKSIGIMWQQEIK